MVTASPTSEIFIVGKSKNKLGLPALIALVIGSMLGGGVSSLPQNMAKGASPGAVMIGWLITGVGMLALAFVYQSLSTRKAQSRRALLQQAQTIPTRRNPI